MAMTIREFADELINTLKTTFPDLFEHASFAVQTVPKPGNLLLTGITVNFHGSNIAPCYYIDEQYNKCLEGTPLSIVASDLAETIRQTSDFQPNIDITAIQDFASAKGHILSSSPSRMILLVCDNLHHAQNNRRYTPDKQ